MPTYTYECDRCGKSFDRVQKITDDVLTVCDLPCSSGDGGGESSLPCGGVVRRVIAGTGGFVLKGGGWGKDGY